MASQNEPSTASASASSNATASNFNYGAGDIDLDIQTQQQQNQIEKEIAENQPLVSEKVDINDLKKEYAAEDQIYQNKLTELMKTYKNVRRTRGDGNCFYRAFGFGFLERNINNEKELDRFRHLAVDLKDKLVKLGYFDFTVEDVRDVVLDVIDNVRKGGTEESLIESFCSGPHSDYFVAYLRLFTSAYLQINSEFFENFIEGGKTVKEFCNSEVEPMARESDNIHIIALAKASAVPLRVIYMDRSQQSALTTHDFSATDEENNAPFEPMITLLYRPGHYDLLYAH